MQGMVMKKQNLDIQFFKFIYSCVIVLYHLASNTAITCRGGYCGVEYFLLSAGLFLFMAFQRGEEKGLNQTPGQYVLKRFLRFLPWSTTAFLATALVERLWIEPVESVVAWADLFSSDIWEILMVKWNGMNNNVHLVNSPAWTLSAMLIVGFFIWTLMYYYKKPFVNLIMPLTLVLGFGYWTHLPSANTELWLGFTTFGTFRTWLIMCLSFYCIPMAEKLSEISFNKKGKVLLTAAEVLIHVFSLCVIVYRADRYYQWLLTGLFMISIAIALSGHSYIAKILENSKLVKLLGDLSMSIYLMHTLVIRVFCYVYDISDWSYADLIPLFAALLVVSLLHYYGTQWIVKGTGYLWRRLKSWITVPEA